MIIASGWLSRKQHLRAVAFLRIRLHRKKVARSSEHSLRKPCTSTSCRFGWPHFSLRHLAFLPALLSRPLDRIRFPLALSLDKTEFVPLGLAAELPVHLESAVPIPCLVRHLRRRLVGYGQG